MTHTGDMQSERPSAVSLELLLDPATEAQIRAEWQALADAGLSSLAAHTSPSNRPHITLLVRASIPPMTRDQLSSVVTLPMPLMLGDPVLFGSGDRRVLARSVVPSLALLDLHGLLHTMVGEDDGETEAAFTRPRLWTPHIALARRLRLDTLPQALRILDDIRLTARLTPVEATTLRRWDAASATVTDLLG
jgi:hypothetical protein